MKTILFALKSIITREKVKTGRRPVCRLLVCLAFVLLALTFAGGERAFASSAQIVLTSDSESISVGDRLTVFIDIEADVMPGSFDAFLLYDEDLFEYVSGPDCVSGGDGILKLSDEVYAESRNTRKYAMAFKAVGRGEGEFTLQNGPELYEFEEGYLMSVMVTPCTVSVLASTAAKTDAGLSDLRCSPGTLTPSFSENETEYRTEVPFETTKLIVSAHAKELSSRVVIEGNDNLVVGQNRVLITVTAENGNEKKYTIYCVRTEENVSVTPTPESLIEDNQTCVGLKVFDGVTYIYGKYDFEVCELPKGFNVPEGYTATNLVMNGQSITAYAQTDEPDADFLLLTLKNSQGEAGLYCYDRVEKTIQRFESGSLSSSIHVAENESLETFDREMISEYENKTGTLTLVIIVLCGVCAMLLVFVIRLFVKGRRGRNDFD